MKKTPLAVIVIFTLLISLTAITTVRVAEANFMPLNIPPHNIEITSDGNVTGTDNIERAGADYGFTANISGSIVVLCDNITINGKGYSLQGNGDSDGIFLEGRQNITIKNLTVNNFENGITYSYGAGLEGDCKNNVLLANNFTNNKYGIFCYQVQNITISRNIISNNSNIGISNFLSEQIQIYGNTLSDNKKAVRFTNCQNSNVYGNNFINNTAPTQVDPESNSGLNYGWSTINWNNRRLGNFWSDYNGSDANGDGIGDTPYIINANNTDHYPLMSPIDISAPIPTPINNEPVETPFGNLLIAVVVVIVVVLVILLGSVLLYRKHRKRYSLMGDTSIEPKKG
jgi:parallel beta-helix repeat protein